MSNPRPARPGLLMAAPPRRSRSNWLARRAARPSLRAFQSLALAACAASAFGQAAAPDAPASAPPAATLPPVRVTGNTPAERAEGPVTGYTARRSGTATLTDTPLNEVPQSITVIGAEQLRDQNSTTMQEALRYTAGVRAELYGLDNRGDYFGLRGGSDGSTLLDGLRQPLTGYWGAVRSEPFAFERIEVLRGPASVIAGQNGPGGVVNMVSKRPLDTPQREVQVQFGNRDHEQIAADLTGPLLADGTLNYRLVALGKDSGSQVDYAKHERTYIAPSLTWLPLAGTKLTVYAEYQKDKSKNENGFFPIEGTLDDVPNGRIPSSTFIGEPDWDTYGGERKRFGWELEQKLSDQWTLRHRLRRDNVTGHLATAYAAWFDGFVNASGVADANPANNTYLNRVGYAADDHSLITSTNLTLEGKLDFGRTRHTLLVGADYLNNRMTHTDFGNFSMTPLDVYHPVYGTSPLPAFDPAAASVIESRNRNLGVLIQDQVKFDDRWVFVAGLRHDEAKTDDAEDKANSKNLGVVYLADGGLSPYLGYSESFEPVTGTDRAGASFKPKRGKQVEAGVKWLPANSLVSASAAVYRLKEANRLSTDPLDPNFSIQLGEATVDGLELEASASLANWQLLTSYTYTRARLTGEFDSDRGEQLASIPKHMASVWATYSFGVFGLPGLRAGGGVRYVGPTWDGAGANQVPSNTLIDVLASYETGPWSLSLNVNNLTDRTYIATCLSRGDCWFGTRRRAVVTLAYRW